MDQRLTDQLDKVLAMVDSSHEGEAMVAVRKARQLLSKGGLNFSDLARSARPSSFSPSLQNRLSDLQADYWRQRALELEKNLKLKTGEAERWRKLAEETVDKLWNLGLSRFGEKPKKTVSRQIKAR